MKMLCNSVKTCENNTKTRVFAKRNCISAFIFFTKAFFTDYKKVRNDDIRVS